MRTAPPCCLVIFGASGDLAQRKLLPALYEMQREKLLNDKTYILGFSRSPMNDDAFRAACRKAAEKHVRTKPFDPAVWEALEQRLYYSAADYGSAEDYARVGKRLAELDERHGNMAANRLFYLATPPAAFEPIIGRLSANELFPAERHGPNHWRRLIIEKPFGRDLSSAKALNRLLLTNFTEEQIFRIDHYLGKETVQNLLVMRFANSIFEPIWNYKYIDHVQITVAEKIGVADRGGYYDQSGALRDMVQNHLFQLMALVAMEPPASLDARSVRDEKVKVYQSIRPLRPQLVESHVVRGQYGPGESAGSHTEGYLKEKGVAADSTTESFVALKLYIDNWRWSGMPFYLRTGKFLPEKLSEIAVRFRSPPLTLFQKQCQSPVFPNDLIVRVQPEEGISWRLNGKVPGGQMNIRSVALDFLYKTAFGVEPPDAYERLIYDAMTGDQTLFIRADETEAAWGVIDPIEQAWSRLRSRPEPYNPGTWGPQRAMELIEEDGRRWLHSGDEPEPIIACSL